MFRFKDINIKNDLFRFKNNKMNQLTIVTEMVFNQDGKYYPGTQIHINRNNIIEVKRVNGMKQLIYKNDLTLFIKDE